MKNLEDTYNILLENGIEPNTLYFADGKSVAQTYFERMQEEENEMARRKWFIHAHKTRQPKIVYIEDRCSQHDIWNLKPGDIVELFRKSGNNVYICYDSFLNRIGHYIGGGVFDCANFMVYAEVDGKPMTPVYYDNGGRLNGFPIGYFNGSF